MAVTYDPAKRDKTLTERQLDFADAGHVLDGPIWDFPDDRTDYGEERITAVGFLGERIIVVVWTRRGENRHIISHIDSGRKANDRERAKYGKYLD